MKAKLTIALLIVCALLLMGSGWKAITSTSVNWYVLSGGGGKVTNGALVLEGSTGQSVTGGINKDSTELCAGYWCGSEEIYEYIYPLYLPVIRHEP
jgi:hypothetical protein